MRRYLIFFVIGGKVALDAESVERQVDSRGVPSLRFCGPKKLTVARFQIDHIAGWMLLPEDAA